MEIKTAANGRSGEVRIGRTYNGPACICPELCADKFIVKVEKILREQRDRTLSYNITWPLRVPIMLLCYEDMIMEFRLFIGCVQGIRRTYFLDDVKDENEAIREAEKKASEKGKKGAFAGVYVREGSTKCDAICGWEVSEDGKLLKRSLREVQDVLQVYSADFDNPPLGSGDLKALKEKN